VWLQALSKRTARLFKRCSSSNRRGNPARSGNGSRHEAKVQLEVGDCTVLYPPLTPLARIPSARPPSVSGPCSPASATQRSAALSLSWLLDDSRFSLTRHLFVMAEAFGVDAAATGQ
jgi:hypothetical protein